MEKRRLHITVVCTPNQRIPAFASHSFTASKAHRIPSHLVANSGQQCFCHRCTSRNPTMRHTRMWTVRVWPMIANIVYAGSIAGNVNVPRRCILSHQRPCLPLLLNQAVIPVNHTSSHDNSQYDILTEVIYLVALIICL